MEYVDTLVVDAHDIESCISQQVHYLAMTKHTGNPKSIDSSFIFDIDVKIWILEH